MRHAIKRNIISFTYGFRNGCVESWDIQESESIIYDEYGVAVKVKSFNWTQLTIEDTW